MKFPPHLLDDIRARLPVSSVVGRKVALKKKGREFAGLSPFKVEKTPSFFVNDQKGFYHCFASGEHGDIFKFLMSTEGLTFPEAVERLAQDAGVTMPKPDPRYEEREDERERLVKILEASAAFFEEQLRQPQGQDARRYLDKRGLQRNTLTTFRLGYAPSSKLALKSYLKGKGFTVEDMVLSGMLIGGDDIPDPYDRFRDRVMFPIADIKGRIIAFGGRALDPSAPAKYLNSPETPLFHKGHNLYNIHRARAAAHDKGRVIAVEGYMDAVALSEGGFGECVAPLGTALTEDQIKLMWRLAPEPILFFDGDSAGQKAAFRAIDVVLPLLEPGRSVRFAFLKDGLDPDDMIRQHGVEAVEAVLDRALPLAQVLFDREWAQGDWSTPERRANLEKHLRALLAKIPEGALRQHYGQDMRQRLDAKWHASYGTQERRPGFQSGGGFKGNYKAGGSATSQPAGFRGNMGSASPSYGQRFQSQRSPTGGGKFGGNRGGGAFGGFGPPLPTSSLVNSALVAGPGTAMPYREALILSTLINHPWLIEAHAEEIASIDLTSPILAKLRDALLSALALEIPLDSQGLRAHLRNSSAERAVEAADRALTHNSDKFARPDAGQAEVEDGWRHTLALHNRQVSIRRSLDAAVRQWDEDGSDAVYRRICELQLELERMAHVADEDIVSEASVSESAA
jgi:DNA primase